MPVIKREQNITEILNNAVKQQQSILDATSDILRRPASIWYNQKFGSQKVKPKKKSKDRLAFDIHSALYEIEEKKSFWHEMKIAFIDFCMDDSWINVSRKCSLLTMNSGVRVLRLVLASVLVVVLLYHAPKSDFDVKSDADHVLFYVDILAMVGFLADSINRALGIPMHVRVTKAFGRETNGLDLLLTSGGIRDAPLVALCLIFGLSPPGMWLRLILLISLTPSFIEAFPHLSILLMSISGAVGSIAITIMLFFLAIIVYASFGHILFGKNDPYHFGSYGLSLWTFFHFAIFDNWMELWNLSYEGCDQYPSDSIVIDLDGLHHSQTIHTRYGSFESGTCTDPSAKPFISTFVFVSFLFLCAYVLMNTSMAAVVIGIKEGLDVYKNMTLFGEEQKITIQDDLVENSINSVGRKKKNAGDPDSSRKGSSMSGAPKVNSKMLKMTGGDNETKRMVMKLDKIWKGETAASRKLENFAAMYGEWDSPMRWAAEYERVMALPVFGYVYVVLSISAAVLQVLTEMSYVQEIAVQPVHIVLQCIFTIDMLSRIFTMNMKKPKKASDWGWLYFVTLLTTILWLPTVLGQIVHIEVMHAFNMLRLVGTLQYFTMWVKDLELIMQAFSVSVYGILLLCLLVLTNFLYFVIAGIMLFRESDPYRFGSVASAFSTMIQILTYDSMDNTMRTNMYGCNYFGYDTGLPEFDELCQPSAQGLGWVSPIYFVCFSIMCSIILMSALIGLIISSMEKLMEIKSAEIEIWKDVDEVAKAYEIPSISVPVMLTLFEDLDKDGNCHLTFVQLQPMMDCVGLSEEQEQFTLFIKVDRDGSGQIEFPEFCELLSIMGLILERTPLAAKKARMAKEMARFKNFDNDLGKRSEDLARTDSHGIMALASSSTPSRSTSVAVPSRSGSIVPARNPTSTGTNDETGVVGAPVVSEVNTVLKATKTAADRKALRGVSTKARAQTMRALEQDAVAAVSKRESYAEGLNATFEGMANSPSKPGSRYESSGPSSLNATSLHERLDELPGVVGHIKEKKSKLSPETDRSNYSANLSANVQQFAGNIYNVHRPKDKDGTGNLESFDEEDNEKSAGGKARRNSGEEVRVKARRLSSASFVPIGEDDDEPQSKFFEDVEDIIRSKNIPTRNRSIFGRNKVAPVSSKELVRGFEMKDRPSSSEKSNSGGQSKFMDDIDALLNSVKRPSRNNSVVVSIAGNSSFGGDNNRLPFDKFDVSEYEPVAKTETTFGGKIETDKPIPEENECEVEDF